jgi:hypothetical protein
MRQRSIGHCRRGASQPSGFRAVRGFLVAKRALLASGENQTLGTHLMPLGHSEEVSTSDPSGRSCRRAASGARAPVLTFKGASFEKAFDILGNGAAECCNSRLLSECGPLPAQELTDGQQRFSDLVITSRTAALDVRRTSIRARGSCARRAAMASGEIVTITRCGSVSTQS